MRARAGSSTRHRQESHRSIDTPVEELSSWLADDVCANCGAPARSNHLYCSEHCKEEDAKHANAAEHSPKASTSAPVLSSYNMSVKKSLNNPTWTEANHDSKFRYPCPPSPNILAKYNSALTSPALVALERSLPNASTSIRKLDKDSQSVSSSGESSSIALQSKSKRRSSSRSTFSSASDVVSTEHGTPSSISEAMQDDASDDLDALDNASDFYLPPSVHPFKSTTTTTTTTTREIRSTTSTPSLGVTPDGSSRSPISRITPTPHQNARQNKRTIEYARKPYNTNLPPPVLFTSPVLAVTTMQKGDHFEGSVETPRRRSSGNLRMSPTSAQATLRARHSTNRAVERTQLSSAPFSGPANVQTTKESDAVALPTKSSPRGNQSPPYLASASSSAGKTLRAMSPLEGTASSLYSAICGRFGCSGMGSSADSLELEDKVNINFSQSPQRPSLSRGHKHTHSAAAILSVSNSRRTSTLAAASNLKMTPANQVLVVDEKGQENISSGEEGAAIESHEMKMKSPPRGRSKARGRRSASHRSPSPPRGVSRRGHSEDIYKQRDDESSAAGISPSSARSQPVPLSQRRISSIAGGGECIDEAEEEHRGRSPTERRSRNSKPYHGRQREETASTVTPLSHSCEMAWPAYGHDMAAWAEGRKVGLVKATGRAINGSKGYDDVDLDEL